LLITPSSPAATEFHAVKKKPQGTVGFPLTTLFFALLLTQPAVLRLYQPRWRLVGAGWRALLKSCLGMGRPSASSPSGSSTWFVRPSQDGVRGQLGSGVATIVWGLAAFKINPGAAGGGRGVSRKPW
jgi:hypothetical protein